MPQVSVIIPLYNKGRYISRALESVLAQTYRDFEIIIVNDGSTDNGQQIVYQCKDPRLRLISQDNNGPGAARNKGISKSKGELLAFLDADDEWMPEFLQKSVSRLQNNPDCDLTASSYFLGKQQIDVSPILKSKGITAGPWKLQKNISVKKATGARYIFNSWAVLCKRTVVEKYGGFRSRGHCDYGEDTYLWLQVMFNHKVYRILEPLVWYHSEASQLGPGRRSAQPIQTFLTDPNPIRINCPPEHRELLERFLARFALATAHNYAPDNNNNIDALHYLLKAFPLMREFRWEYAKLKLKMRLPALMPFVRRIKRNCLIHYICTGANN